MGGACRGNPPPLTSLYDRGLSRRFGAFAQELIQFGAILRYAQPLKEFLELALLVFKAAQRFGAVFVERAIFA